MSFQTASGAALLISATLPATYNEAGYGALTGVTVGEVTNIGEFGKEWALVTHEPLADRGVKKAKGNFNNGTLNPTVALDPEDAGQVLMQAAHESDDAVALCVRLKDGTEYWFTGLVMNFRPNVGSANDVVSAACTIEIDHNEIVVVPAV